MAAPKTKKNGNSEKIVRPVNSVHIVIYACSNCGEEVEELKLCNECNSPMKVIQVVEKYGEEADEYLEQLKKDGNWGAGVVTPKKSEEAHDGGISTDEIDSLDIPITGLHEEEEDDEPAGLGEIFPDDEESGNKPAAQDMDFMEALEALDEEEEVENMEGLDDGLPEL